MKKYCLFLMGPLLIWNNVSGEIKNGYRNEINTARESLKNLSALLRDNNLSKFEARKVNVGIESSLNIIVYYELTENLLDHFRTIATDLYNEVDTIKDVNGHPVDVYVRFIPADGTAVKAWGTTYIGQAEDDGHVNRSEYGNYTVSVKIWAVSKALLVLAHELGHVKYQIPNLASYVEFYEKNYKAQFNLGDDIGHKPDDPSGHGATLYVKRYRQLFSNYLKTTDAKMITPLAILNDIRRDLKTNKTTNRNQEPLARRKK